MIVISKHRESLFFVAVGAVSALVHVSALYIWVHFYDIAPVYANVFAFLCAFLVSFCGHYLFTFVSGNKKLWRCLVKWFLSSCSAFLLNQLLYMLGLFLLGNRYYLLLWFVVTIIVTVFSFIIAKYWAFVR